MATKSEILAPLNDEQKDAVQNYNGKIQLEAVPGSGKTKSIVSRCQYMITDHIKASKILVFTFTKRAAEELRTRIRKAVGTDADKMTICTYHSFCCKILRKFPGYINRTKCFSIYDDDDKDKILGPIVKSYFKGVGVEPMPLSTVKNYISRFKMRGLSPSEAKASDIKTSFEKAAVFIYESYMKEMEKVNALDFDDLPFFAYRILNAYPEVLDYVTGLYEYIISDENQDSNKQNLAFILLVGSKSKNIMLVGDSDQSIYKFRGSDVANVISVSKKEGFQKKCLKKNYRSTQTIVDASMEVIKNNKMRIPKATTTDNPAGEKITVIKFKNDICEAIWIAKQIESMKTESNNYKDFAILCRTGYQTKVLEQAFLRCHVPFNIKGSVPFYCRTEVKDLLSYLKYSYNSSDLISLQRIINIPKRGIGKVSENKLLEVLPKTAMNDIITSKEMLKKVCANKKAQANLIAFGNIISVLQQMISDNRSISDMLNYVIDTIDYKEYLSREYKVDETYQDKLSNVLELVTLSSTYKSLEDFLNNAVLDDPASEDKEELQKKDGVDIMTMHSAKGLEYPVVFIFGATDSSIPFFRSHDNEQDIEEERRLFYVAMTRAEKELCISYSQSISLHGKEVLQQHSRFIDEIPEQYKITYEIT